MKKIIPCIYLKKKNAVRNYNDNTLVSADPVLLAKSYSDNAADEILVYDLSENDTEHEDNLDVIKAICTACEVPVVGAGNVKRMEDIKKLLYAGCKKAVLDYEIEGNIEITEEVSKKFGKDKILASFKSPKKIKEQCTLIDEYISETLFFCEKPAEVKQETETDSFLDVLESLNAPTICVMENISLEKILEIMKKNVVFGISGNVVNDNYKDIFALKNVFKDNEIEVNTFEPKLTWSDFKLNSDGHVPVVVQDYKTDEVLMVAYMNEESFHRTLQTGKMTYYSRSRQELWLKGETSGHFQYVKSLTADCDFDTILAKVSQIGAACHTGNHSCFFNEIVSKELEEESNPLKVFEDVYRVIKDRKVHPKDGSYTNYLFDKGIDKILKKLGEEATEIVIAAKNPNPNEIKYEISDFLYHMMVLMAEKEITWEEITTELANR